MRHLYGTILSRLYHYGTSLNLCDNFEILVSSSLSVGRIGHDKTAI